MIPSSSDTRPSARPLAVASGRGAWSRLVAAALAFAVTLLLACDSQPVGVGNIGGPLTPGGGGTPGGGSTVSPTFVQVSAGEAHTCALTQTSLAWCWGRNADGQLGTGRLTNLNRPDSVRSGGQSYRVLSAGGAHTCALDQNNVGWCWGRNAEGQLGVGTTVARLAQPARVTGTRSWIAISAGATHTCALSESGTPYCWGSNSDGQLGNGLAGNQAAPVQVTPAFEAIAISAGDRFTCALRATGVAVCWGRDGRLGAAGASATPRNVGGTTTFSTIEAGGRATCGVESAVARVSCWGEVGAVGSTASGVTPARVTLENVDLFTVSVGGTSACALTLNGLARCWGSNTTGQLGAGITDAQSVTPRAVVGDTLWQTISVGGSHACAISERLQTFCWGSNASGQLGIGPGTAPVRVPTLVP